MINKELYKKIKNRWKTPAPKTNICHSCMYCMNQKLFPGCIKHTGREACPGFELGLRPLKTNTYSAVLSAFMLYNAFTHKDGYLQKQ